MPNGNEKCFQEQNSQIKLFYLSFCFRFNISSVLKNRTFLEKKQFAVKLFSPCWNGSSSAPLPERTVVLCGLQNDQKKILKGMNKWKNKVVIVVVEWRESIFCSLSLSLNWFVPWATIVTDSLSRLSMLWGWGCENYSESNASVVNNKNCPASQQNMNKQKMKICFNSFSTRKSLK